MRFSLTIMNKLLLLLALVLQTVSGFGQQFATLSGEVNHATTDTVSVSWRPEPFAAREQLVTVHLDPRGRFQLQVPMTSPVAARLLYGGDDTPLFLEPGDALRFKFRAEEMATTLKVHSADGGAHKQAAAANNYLALFENEFTNKEGYQVLPENILLYEAPFLTFLEYRRSRERSFLREQGGIGTFTPAFQAYAEAEIAYAYANDRLTYADLREQVVPNDSRIQLKGDYYGFLNDPSLVPGPENAPASDQYDDFMLNYIHFKVKANGIAASAPGYYPACYQLAKEQFKGAARAPLMGLVLAETFRFGHIDHAKAMLADFAKLAPASAVTMLQQDFAELRSRAIGAPAPLLPLRTGQGKPVDLKAYRGKLVYVMFWDTRLALSQRELPFLKDQAEHSEGQPVVFVCAAMDADSASWHRMVTAQGAVGVQAWVPAAEQAAVKAAYGIQQLPAFVLLDEAGLILDPRPKRLSSRALQDDLKGYVGRAAAYRAVVLPKGGK